MPTKLKIISHEFVNESYLRLEIVSGNQPCGTIDLITEKANFNITGKYFYKGMETIKNIQLEYKGKELVFTFRNKKHLLFTCDRTVFTIIRTYTQAFQ
ncbi:MAG: hypothetical protein K0R59_433 [Sphingobacterium sp.]|nr:hypothetical protein [Sphingobacterium sp.]OOG19402.1 hypothetical protein BWD42_05580 [Sphingobacterium sp. CZ-UAM]